MRLAITGCNGCIGIRVVVLALQKGHSIFGIDITEMPKDLQHADNPNFSFAQVDLGDYNKTLETLKRAGVEGIIQLAGIPTPTDYGAVTHNTNVVINWNVLRSAAELGINRVAQASSVNVITLFYSLGPELDYLPLDEEHPCRPDEPYGLSKLICELQATSIVRRYPSLRIASLRGTWFSTVPSPSKVELIKDPAERSTDLWGYVYIDSGAEAFILAVTNSEVGWSGHEVFLITAPDTTQKEGSMELKEKFWPDVPLKNGKDLDGRKSFFDCSKAEKMLGWVHSVPGT
ncbi:NAD(P)-binding protein [Abortiporus biennis]|nr:NAD(P)-binding protein [Abortiporus biennis]